MLQCQFNMVDEIQKKYKFIRHLPFRTTIAKTYINPTYKGKNNLKKTFMVQNYTEQKETY